MIRLLNRFCDACSIYGRTRNNVSLDDTLNRIVKRHDGRISVKSVQNAGTTFTIIIPIGEASRGPAPELGGAADLRMSAAEAAPSERAP